MVGTLILVHTIKKCHEKVLNSGSVADNIPSGRPKTTLSNGKIETNIFERNPTISIGKAVR